MQLLPTINMTLVRSFICFLIIMGIGSCNEPSQNTKFDIQANIDEFKKAILSGQSYFLMQEDDSIGEWGGTKVFINIKSELANNIITVDIKKVLASKEPPPPPHSDSINVYNDKLTILNSKNIRVDENQIELVFNAILELTDHKMRDLEIGKVCSGFGFKNFVSNSDSTFLIRDCQSIRWNNFQELKKSLKVD